LDGTCLRFRISAAFTSALHMESPQTSKVSAIVALRCGSALLSDLEEGSVGVVTRGGAVSLDARLATGEVLGTLWCTPSPLKIANDLPCKFLVVNENLRPCKLSDCKKNLQMRVIPTMCCQSFVGLKAGIGEAARLVPCHIGTGSAERGQG
jgi:hypothetical protein